MRIDRKFPVQVLGVLVFGLAIAAYPLYRFSSSDVMVAVAIGAGLSTVNVLAGFLAIEYSFGRSHTTFLRVVLGGMGIRMVFLLGAILVLIKLVGVDIVALTSSLFCFYTIFLVLEVIFIQKKTLKQ